ncbi:MAG: hypothetical protein ACE5E6_03545 [Phycisphaerae bacterium]
MDHRRGLRMRLDRSRVGDKPLVLVTVGGGGWHQQGVRLVERLSTAEFRFAYVYGINKFVTSTRRLTMPHDGPRYPMRCIAQTHRHAVRRFTNLARFAWSLADAFRLIRRLRPQAVIALATTMSVPLFVAARCLGIPCVFIESLTRSTRLSWTGRVVYHLRLAQRFYVQWPGLRERHRRATFAGAAV